MLLGSRADLQSQDRAGCPGGGLRTGTRSCRVAASPSTWRPSLRACGLKLRCKGKEPVQGPGITPRRCKSSPSLPSPPNPTEPVRGAAEKETSVHDHVMSGQRASSATMSLESCRYFGGDLTKLAKRAYETWLAIHPPMPLQTGDDMQLDTGYI